MRAAPPHPADAARPTVRAPEPACLWIRYAPRGWPAPPLPWLDLARGGLEAPGQGEAETGAARLPELAGGPFDDVVWLPPVPEHLHDERDRLADRLLAAGTPVLVQAFPGERVAPPAATAVYDLTAALLSATDVDERAGENPELLGERGGGVRAELSRLPRGSAALWPLVAGLTDDQHLVAAGLDALAAAGVAVVQPVVPRLSAGDRRRLAEGAGEGAFDRLFHGADADERAFARAAAARGLAFLLPRPLPRPPLGGAGNRRLAAWLAVAADLWLRLGRPPSQGQAFFRAARWADETGYDLPALAREGNLGVVETIDAASRALIEEAAASGREPALVAELIEHYVAEEAE
jgi:hypothetical protein